MKKSGNPIMISIQIYLKSTVLIEKKNKEGTNRLNMSAKHR